MNILDISSKIHPDMAIYSGDPPFRTRCVCGFAQGDVCEVSEMTLGSHCGTHIDAPLHMIPGGAAIDRLSLSCFLGPCRVITLPFSQIDEAMIRKANVRRGERILLRTGSHEKGATRGQISRPAALSVCAARLLAQLPVQLVGIDTLTIEDMEQSGGEVHRILLGAGVGILEGLCLSEVKGERYWLSALPLNIAGGNGSPCRAVLIEE